MVFLVPVVADAAVVHKIKESRESSSSLKKWSHSTVLWETVFVIPPPVSARHGSADALWRHVASRKPLRQFLQLHLTKGNILLSIEHGWVIRSMNSFVVFLRKFSKTHYKRVFVPIADST